MIYEVDYHENFGVYTLTAYDDDGVDVEQLSSSSRRGAELLLRQVWREGDRLRIARDLGQFYAPQYMTRA